ncbi:hypothetical protein Esi_0086_0098 [Ectocarpus siliculosus]|uniref:Uncharacterized protein n=1 Tax=Ectocarpus siliculosus TaxID=2880 RepID=D7G821_ECTSI|nr:hypothetical protein Esi_0086_0098 [Ectocarpus siliculosus]|eukprot:CBJ27896.1 hypothetical protein Esi_0086_0098 [Ectocarpus siliculosus]
MRPAPLVGDVRSSSARGAWHAAYLKTWASFQHLIHPDLARAAGRSGRGGVGERRAKREEGESSKSAGRSISSWDADEMDSIARRCKLNPRAASRPQSGPFGAEGLARLRRTIRSVQQCTNEAGQGVTSNVSKERLESAQRDCMSACLNVISSRGEEPGGILKAASIFVGKISSTYTDETIERVKTIKLWFAWLQIERNQFLILLLNFPAGRVLWKGNSANSG